MAPLLTLAARCYCLPPCSYIQARLAPFLPGSLMAPALVSLHAKLQYLVQPAG